MNNFQKAAVAVIAALILGLGTLGMLPMTKLLRSSHAEQGVTEVLASDDGGNGFKDMLRQVLKLLREMRDTMSKIATHEENMDKNIQRMADKICK